MTDYDKEVLSKLLEEEQYRKVSALLNEARAEINELRAQLKGAQSALSELLESVEECFDTRRGDAKHLRRVVAARKILE